MGEGFVFFEEGHNFFIQGVFAGDNDFRGVNEVAVLFDTEVQVRACGYARSAHVADNLSLFDFGAVFESFGKAGHVGVLGFEACDVFYLDSIAVAAAPAYFGNGAVAHGFDGCTCGGSVVHALVGSICFIDGVEAVHGVAGADAGKG